MGFLEGRAQGRPLFLLLAHTEGRVTDHKEILSIFLGGLD
jgi:hypothetical protein